jgi:hypothetical protein
MNDDVVLAGKVLSGKEGERAPQDMAKGGKFKGATAGSVATDKAIATKGDDSEQKDEFYTDVLARFGIQI